MIRTRTHYRLPLAFIASSQRKSILFGLMIVVGNLIFMGGVFGQTTYIWSGANGASWNVSTNWTPTRTGGGATTDILVFNSGTTLTVIDVNNQTIGKLQITGSGSNITLKPVTSTSPTLTISAVATDALTVASGCTLTILGIDAATDRNLNITTSNTSGLEVNIDGTVIVGYDNGQINAAGSFAKGANAVINFKSGSLYQHAINGGNIPVSNWDPNSTCNITGIIASYPGNTGQAFGNLTFDCPSMSSGSKFMANTGLSIAGNFQIINTGLGVLQMNQASVNVEGYCLISDDFQFNNTSNSPRTLNVNGDFTLTAGTFSLSISTGIDTLQVKGNFSLTGGTLTENGTNPSVIFSKSGTQIYTSGSTVSNAILFIVNNGTTLQMASVSTSVDGAGSFTLAAGATLGITSNAGVNSIGTNTGNILTTAARTYTAGSNFLYNGSANQSAGSGLAATTKANITINNPGNTVTLEGNTLLTGALTLNEGSNLALSTFNIGSPTSVVLKCGATAASSISGSGTLTLGGPVNVMDATTGTNGATISCPIVLGATRTMTVEDDGTSAADLTLGGIVSGGSSVGITKEGAGTLVLTGTNTYQGATSINSGILCAQNSSAVGATSGGVTVASGARLEVQGNISVGNEALSLAGEGGVTNEGALCNVSGTNTWGGAITINAATTRIGSASGLLTLSSNINLQSNTLTLQGSSTSANLISGIISGSGGSLIKEGTGTWSLSNSNNFTGGVTLSNGKLNINNSNALGTIAGTFTIGGAGNSTTIDNATGSAITILDYPMNWNDDFTFTGTQSLNLGTGIVALQENRQVAVSANTLTVGGVISGSGYSLTKNGNGILTLTGVNTFTGGTVLNAGTLNINNSNALGTAAGTFVINGGMIDNTTASSITTLNYPMAWNDDFTFTGTRSLNLGTSAVAMQENRIVTTNANTLTVGGTISGSGLSLTKSGAGTLTLSGANDFSGGTTLIA
ncbi:MAG: autotransporter-associated beta strand repeat-containing protein, partial [Saprospiraceae bacterium]